MSEKFVNALLPKDLDSKSIQLLTPDTTVHISATEGASANVALPSDTKIVRISASGAVWVAFGGASVDANVSQADSLLFPAGAEFFFVRTPTYTHVAARSVSGSGNQVFTATKMI